MMQYWERRVVKGWLWIVCPILETEKKPNFGIRRGIIKELRQIETEILKKSLKGWIAYTELKNKHIMKYLVKIGATAYDTDLTEQVKWFKKEIQNV